MRFFHSQNIYYFFVQFFTRELTNSLTSRATPGLNNVGHNHFLSLWHVLCCAVMWCDVMWAHSHQTLAWLSKFPTESQDWVGLTTRWAVSPVLAQYWFGPGETQRQLSDQYNARPGQLNILLRMSDLVILTGRTRETHLEQITQILTVCYLR